MTKKGPYFSISLQLEATKYPGIKSLIDKSGIKKSIRDHAEKHITLVVMTIPFKDVIKKMMEIDGGVSIDEKKFIKDDKVYDKTMKELKKYVETKTTEYVLRVIKPVIDKEGVIELKFMGLELWPSGHFVGVFDEDHKEFKWIVIKMRELLKRIFPTGTIMRQHDMIPHITLGKYDADDLTLFHKLKQPKVHAKSYKLMKKQWIIYPSIRYKKGF